jgi:4-aminobutyrate aminotransferase-like enzyme
VEGAWKRGVILATASALPNVIKIKPPLIIEEAEVALVLDVLADSLKAVYGTRG